MKPAPAIKLRTAQRRFLRLVDEHRLICFLARRQFGKTTTFAALALKKMMKKEHHTVIFGSAKLNLSREIVRKEAEIIQKAIRELQAPAVKEEGLLKLANAETGKAIQDELSADDFADLFEAQRLEFRFFHGRSSYSRTKVVALRPDTVGETGDLMCDEIGRIGNWREVWEAVEPIISSSPEFRLTLATTPPPDDSHYSFEMLAAPLEAQFRACAEGNLYRSEIGIAVLRVDAWDAWEDGVPVYDLHSGEPLDPAEHRRRSLDKDAWDRNYGCKFVLGGTAACGLLQLETAQRRGIGQCALFYIETEADVLKGIAFVRQNLGAGKVGLGFDLATTEKGTSNPSAFTVLEECGPELVARAVFVWKTKDDLLAEHRAEAIVDAVAARKEGGRARALAVDATNERYFAGSLRRKLAAKVPVELVVASESYVPIGREAMPMKQYLGSVLVGDLDDNHLTLPPERYLREDWRLVKRARGTFDNEVSPDGKHGDTFDGTKLARFALLNKGPAYAAAMQVGHGAATNRLRERCPMQPDHSADLAGAQQSVMA